MKGPNRICLVGAALLAGVSGLQVQRPLVSEQQDLLVDDKATGKPAISSEALQGTIKKESLLARAKELYEIAKLSEDEYNHPTRVIGSKGHAGTLEYIYSTLAKMNDYYFLSNQSFSASSGSVAESRLVLGDEVSKSASPMGLTPATKDKQPVHGDLIVVSADGCEASDYPAEVKGNIAFIRRGTCPFGTKSEQAGLAGAVAAVVYNTDKEVVHGTLGTPSPNHVATFGLSGDEAEPVLAKLAKGKRVDAIAYIDAEVKVIVTTNILAQTIEGDPYNCVMLGGHSDSVSEGPGINDDGSGSLSLLEVATQLTKFSLHNCVRFAWWSGEEEGLLGSDFYVDQLPMEENIMIRVFMDYDMLASPNYAFQVYDARDDSNPKGSESLRNLYVDWYEAHELNHTFIPFDGRSDYDAFIRNGIPGGGIATGAEGVKTGKEEGMFGGHAGDWYDPCYHQLCDDVGNLNLTAWELNTKLVAHSVATYAHSFEGFPKRQWPGSGSVKAAGAYGNAVKYHGSKLFI